jgi:hypothetical protein
LVGVIEHNVFSNTLTRFYGFVANYQVNSLYIGII